MQVKKIIVCMLIIFSSFAHGSNDQLIKNEQALLKINRFFSGIEESNIENYKDGELIVFLVDEFGGRFYEDYYMKIENNNVTLVKIETLSLYKEDFDIKSLRCIKFINESIVKYDRESILMTNNKKCYTVYMVDNSLIEFREYIKNNKNFDVNESRIDWYINRYNIDQKNVSIYNDIAFYLGEGHNYNSSLYILKKIIKIHPNRIVAYLNIADVYWEIGNKDHAKVYYQEYISRMGRIGKKSIIPKRVFQRVR